MTSEEIELLKNIDDRLKQILRLQVEAQFDDDASNKEKVRILYQMGFDNSEMAEIVGTSEGSIRAAMSDLRSEGEIE